MTFDKKKIFKQKIRIFFIKKILYFIGISLKCTSCRIKGFQKKCDGQTYIQTKRFIEELRS